MFRHVGMLQHTMCEMFVWPASFYNGMNFSSPLHSKKYDMKLWIVDDPDLATSLYSAILSIKLNEVQ